MVKRGATSATKAAAAAAAAASPRKQPPSTSQRQQQRQQKQQKQQKQLGVVESGGTIKPDRPPTEYEIRVYKLCKAIPRGKVSTYGAMAQVLNSSARAVGQSMRRNPFAPDVPCHRVVAANLELGGFSGSWGLHCANVQRKRQMLQDEGVRFEGDKVSSSSLVQADELQRLLKLQGPVEFKKA